MARLCLVLALVLGILAPRASAIAMDMLPGQFQTIIICNGFEMQTITVDAQGRPVQIAESDSHQCVMKETIAQVTAPDMPVWQTIARAHQALTLRDALLHAPLAAVLPPPSQGPPLTV